MNFEVECVEKLIFRLWRCRLARHFVTSLLILLGPGESRAMDGGQKQQDGKPGKPGKMAEHLSYLPTFFLLCGHW